MKPAELIIWGAGIAGAGVASYLVWNNYFRATEGEPTGVMAAIAAASAKPGAVGQGYINGKQVSVTLAEAEPGKYLRSDAATAYKAMKAAALAAGHNLDIISAFRTMGEQTALWNGWQQKLPGFNLAAKPGYSNHQAGLSIDANTQSKSSPLYLWLKQNAAKFGFKNDVPSEHWHWTYVGSASFAWTGLSGLGAVGAAEAMPSSLPSTSNLLLLGGAAALVIYQVFVRPDEGPRTIRKGAATTVKLAPNAFNG